jgi:hypothetical protein
MHGLSVFDVLTTVLFYVKLAFFTRREHAKGLWKGPFAH